MEFTSLITIALILIAISAIKILILLVKPQKWMNFAKWVYGGEWTSRIIFLILAGIVFYFLIQDLTIVQILSVTLFVSLFIGLGFVGFANDLIKIYEKRIKNKSLWKNGIWFYTLLWVVLLAWGVKEIFF